MMTLLVGRKGRLKISKREFEITLAGPGSNTTIKFRDEHETHQIADTDLRSAADDIECWSNRE